MRAFNQSEMKLAAVALDLGSTAVKAALLYRDGGLGEVASVPAPAMVAEGGRHECNAMDYLAAAEQVLAQCCASITFPLSLGLSCQRSSFLLWRKDYGVPVTPLISWQDTRGAASCEVLQQHEGLIKELTGLRLTPYYFAPKLRVLFQQFPHYRESLLSGEYLLGTLDTFLIWRWTGGKYHVSDASMAARTLLMDVVSQRWSAQLCEIFQIPATILPHLIPSSGLDIELDNGLTLRASLGDQSAAFLGAIGSQNNAALVNLGTGGFVMRELARGVCASGGYLNTLLYQDSKAMQHMAAEGTLNSIAAALQHYPVNECRLEDLACNDIFCLAEAAGLGAPYFRKEFGLHFSGSTAHLSRQQIAALLIEAIVFRVARILEEFQQQAALEAVYLSGGLSGITCLQQGIAQCAALPVYRLLQKEASLQGAGFLAAGMPAVQPQCERVVIAQANAALTEKYRRWKNWLDELLANPVAQAKSD